MSEALARPNRHELIRRHNESLVLQTVGSASLPMSRASIAKATGLSRPTVDALVDELCASGLLRGAGTRTGVVGRPASLIEVNPGHASVGAIALDASGVQVLVADITGLVRSEVRRPLPRSGSIAESTIELVGETHAESGLFDGRLHMLTVSEPGVDAPAGVTRALAPNLPELDDAIFAKLAEETLGSPVRFDNDVNLAALGEYRYGIARGEGSFAFILVDAGIGMGLMVNGEILRGAHGAAGEAGFLPVGEVELSGRAVRIGALEVQAGEHAFLARYRKLSGRPRATLPMIWERASNGEPEALEVVQEEADLISRAVLAVAAIMDPSFVVLGGSIGGEPLIGTSVMDRMRAIAPFPVEIRRSALGERAALLGALATALDAARERLGLPPLDAARL